MTLVTFGIELPDPDEVLQRLREYRAEFVLTGSYFFGTARANSDVDLFTEDNRDVERFLAACGFIELPGGYYHRVLCDTSLRRVLRNVQSRSDSSVESRSTSGHSRGNLSRYNPERGKVSTKTREECPKCGVSAYPTDSKVKIPQLGFLGLWRYECEICGWVWANELQRTHNERLVDKAHAVGSGGGWYS